MIFPGCLALPPEMDMTRWASCNGNKACLWNEQTTGNTHREGVGHSLDTQFCELPPAATFKCAQSHSSTRTTTRDSAQEVKIAQPTTSHAKAQGERWGQRQKQEQAWMWPKRAGAADQQGSRDQGWEEIVLGLQPAQRVQQGSSGRIM